MLVFQRIMSSPDGQELLGNVIEALHYGIDERVQGCRSSGSLCIERQYDDTIERTLQKIETHFGLK